MRYTLEQLNNLKKQMEVARSNKQNATSHSGDMTDNSVAPVSEPSLLRLLRRDVEVWLKSHEQIFTNERHLQVSLAQWLEKSKDSSTGVLNYNKVETEYRVPLGELRTRGVDVPASEPWRYPLYPWPNQMSVDIVVEKDGRFAAIELKYPTSSVSKKFNIFGEEFECADSKVLKNQAAIDLAMYNYCKDIRRIEVLADTFESVEGGLAIMVTNNSSMWNEPRTDANYVNFSLHEGRLLCAGLLSWRPGTAKSITESHPNFFMRSSYTFGWHDTAIPISRKSNRDYFQYLITTITPSK